VEAVAADEATPDAVDAAAAVAADMAVAAVDAAAEVAAAVAAVAAVVAAAKDGDTNNSPGHLLLLRHFVTKQGFRIHCW
jgi:hypothetical protein